MIGRNFDPGFDIALDLDAMAFRYGPEVFGPPMTYRRLDDIRQALPDPKAEGPERVYAIAMDVGRVADRLALQKHNLLYGACIYAAGKVGEEPVRSQGHIHAVSPSCQCSTPELYEIWYGRAIVFMQPGAGSETDRAYAVDLGPGDKLIVPPGYAHYTVNADPTRPMAFGAWCVRDYGFEYDKVRAMGGLAYTPLLDATGGISFKANPRYHAVPLTRKRPEEYSALGLSPDQAMYPLIARPDLLRFVARPYDQPAFWDHFVP